VRRALLGALEVLLLPTIGLAVAVLLAPGRAELAVHVYVLVILGATMVALVSAIRDAAQPAVEPSLFELGLRKHTGRHERLPDLARLEREVTLACSSAFDVHYRLRPILREVAAGLLAARRGVELDHQPERACAILGEETWELVRPDREAPHNRLGPGIEERALRCVVTSLEAL